MKGQTLDQGNQDALCLEPDLGGGFPGGLLGLDPWAPAGHSLPPAGTGTTVSAGKRGDLRDLDVGV